MRHPAWHKEWNTWAKKRWIDFLCEIPWSWAARELNIRPDFAVEEPGITVGNLEGVARVKLITDEEPAYTLKPGIYDEFLLPQETQLPPLSETCGPGKGISKPESMVDY